MKNILDEYNNPLPQVDYTQLLDQLIDTITTSKTPLFQLKEDLVIIDADIYAQEVARLSQGHSVVDSKQWGKTISINFGGLKKKNQFQERIKRLQQALHLRFSQELEAQLPQTRPEDYVTALLRPLRSFTEGKGGPSQLPPLPGFAYPFLKSFGPLSSRHLAISQKPGSPQTELFQGHRVTITVKNTHQFGEELVQGILKYVQRHTTSSQYPEPMLQGLEVRLREQLKENTSELYQLLRVISAESLGKLKQEAGIRYLELLYAEASEGPAKHALHALFQRLKAIKAYASAYSQTEYEIAYAGVAMDMRDDIARANVFDVLPIIAQIVGSLGKIVDAEEGERSFLFGLRLKLNFPLTAYGFESVLEYYLNQLNPNSEEHRSHVKNTMTGLAPEDDAFKRRVLQLAYLYDIIFTEFQDPSFDAILHFRQHTLPVLQGEDDEAKRQLFTQIYTQAFGQQETLIKLRKELQTLIRKHPIREELQGEPLEVHISLQQRALSHDIRRMFQAGRFLDEDIFEIPRSILKYLTVDLARITGEALCKLPVTITFSPTYYQSMSTSTMFPDFHLKYAIEPFDVLPGLFYPRSDPAARKQLRGFFRRPYLCFPYQHTFPSNPDPKQAHAQQFSYAVTFTLLTYMCWREILTPLPVERRGRKLFLPLLRLHHRPEQEQRGEERIVESCTKVVAHLLSESYLSNAQGLFLDDILLEQMVKGTDKKAKAAKGRLQNALSSLYSVLPKQFSFLTPSLLSPPSTEAPHHVNKVAFIVVSSRACDTKRGVDFSWVNVYGEAIGYDATNWTAPQMHQLRTFSANYPKKQQAEVPGVLIDMVRTCRDAGYKHIFYIAKSPYFSTLNLVEEDKDEELYFMNPNVIQAMKAVGEDLKLYPIFYDKYFVVKKEHVRATSFLIPDANELKKVAEDPSHRSVMFFNLLNGYSVGEGEKYHGVIAYMTLLNRYQGILDDEDLWLGLITGNEREPNTLKNDLLRALLLLHFARYERQYIQMLKLDPYEHIIGTESLGARALLPHSLSPRITFHQLAFLTEVRRILNLPAKEDGAHE